MQSYNSPSNPDLNHEVAVFYLPGWCKCSLLYWLTKEQDLLSRCTGDKCAPLLSAASSTEVALNIHAGLVLFEGYEDVSGLHRTGLTKGERGVLQTTSDWL